MRQDPYPLDQGGQKIVILLFSRVGGVKNVILQYSILREKCNLTFFGTMGKLKNVSYESSGWHIAGTSSAEAFQLYIYIARKPEN